MPNRVLACGAAALVFSGAILLNLWIVDLMSLAAVKESLGRISGVVAVTTVAALAIGQLARLSARK